MFFYFIILGLDLNDDHSGLFVKDDAVHRDSVEALLDLFFRECGRPPVTAARPIDQAHSFPRH